jgi:hypothetical protein
VNPDPEAGDPHPSNKSTHIYRTGNEGPSQSMYPLFRLGILQKIDTVLRKLLFHLFIIRPVITAIFVKPDL